MSFPEKHPLRSASQRWTLLRQDAPSLLFLLLVAANTALIVGLARFPLLQAVLALFQGVLLIGCQETKHQCVHGTFLSHRRANDLVGAGCAALFGVNFVAYRYFHLQHHRHVCTVDDPEGGLYRLSWSTRWIWLLAPLELGWVAWHINRQAWALTPPRHHRARRGCLLAIGAMQALLLGLTWAMPATMLWVWLVPLMVFAWLDFLLTQAEHYGVPVAASGAARRDPGEATLDIVLPAPWGWLTLYRSLHRVHHGQPGLRWFEAPHQWATQEGGAAAARALSYPAFVRRWWAQGPRLWRDATGRPV